MALFKDYKGKLKSYKPASDKDTPELRREKSIKMADICHISDCANYASCGKIQKKGLNVKCVNFKSQLL